MKTQRQKFEAFMKDILEYADFRKKGGNYICPHMQNDWGLWQAAIESVVVGLGSIDGVTDDNGRTSFDVVSRYDVERALEKAGVKYE